MLKARFEQAMHHIYTAKSDSENADTLRVIGAGLSRTGTASLKAALEQLGFGPCHHGMELIDKPNRAVQFIRAYEGHKIDFYALMKGYGSTVDLPTADFYKEIHQAFPKAKIVLTVRRSGEKWFESIENSIGPLFTDDSLYFSIYLLPFLRPLLVVCRLICKKWTAEYGGVGPWIHDKHNARVIKENKEDDLLIFNVEEGWPPLCKFLGVDIPEGIPFPHVNDTNDIKRLIVLARVMGWCLWAFLGAAIAVGAYFLIRLIT